MECVIFYDNKKFNIILVDVKSLKYFKLKSGNQNFSQNGRKNQIALVLLQVSPGCSFCSHFFLKKRYIVFFILYIIRFIILICHRTAVTMIDAATVGVEDMNRLLAETVDDRVRREGIDPHRQNRVMKTSCLSNLAG